MTMHFKKAAALFVCVLLLLTGCTTGGSSSKTVDYSNVSMPDSIEITTPMFFYNYDDGVSSADERTEWIDSVSAHYGVELNVVTPVEETYQSMLVEALNGTSSGIYDVASYSNLLSFIEKGAILPLDDYLKDNTAWLSLPKEMREMYEINGHIWAIPSSYYYNCETRTYRTDWLETLGMEMPTDLTGFKAFCEAVLASDAIEQTPVAATADLSWAVDILAAFGVYIDADGRLPYAYDPDADCFADGLLSENAVAAFEYLRTLYQEGAICLYMDTLTYDDVWDEMESGNFGTWYGDITSGKYGYGMYVAADQIYEETTVYPTAQDDWEQLTNLFVELVALSGDSAGSGKQLLYPESRPYVLLSTTAQPAETINFFVDMLYASEANYLECRVGLGDNYVYNADGTISLKMILDTDASSEAGESVYISRHQAGLVGRVDGLYAGSEAFIIDTTDEFLISSQKELAAYKKSMIQAALNDGTAVKTNIKYSAPQSSFLINEDNYTAICTNFYNFFTAAITGTSRSVESLLSEYKDEMEKLGATQVLTQANEAVGKTTAQRY